VALKASKVAYEEFLKSSVWADLKDIIEERIALNVSELEYESPNEDVWIDIRRVAASRAKLGELRYLEVLPKFLLSHYDELSKIEEGEGNVGTS
jgi:hypothetical protein